MDRLNICRLDLQVRHVRCRRPLPPLGARLAIDVAACWRPTARTYFDRITKPAILAIFEEVGGTELRARYAGAKKHDLAASAEKLFAGETVVEAQVKDKVLAWLPPEMRFAPVEASVEDAPDANSDDASGLGAEDDSPPWHVDTDDTALPQAA